MPSIAGSGTLVAFLLLAGAAAAAPGDVLSTDKTDVNVRNAPSTDAEIMARINPGDIVFEVRTEDDWHLVRLPDGQGEGWIFSPLLQQVTNAPEPSVPVPGKDKTEAAAAPAVPVAPAGDRLASRTAAFDGDLVGDPKNGETVFYKCGSCHTTVLGVHAQGPSLVGVFGRPPALAPGFRYSGAMQSFARDGAVWDEATLDRFIQRPARVVKGTSMPFSGVRDPQDRRDLIAYLQQLSN